MSSNNGEKTEQPTEKRFQDARKKGQAAKSQELTSALLLIAVVIVVWSMSGYLGGFIQNSFKEQIEFAANFKGEFTNETSYIVLWKALTTIGWILTPIFIVVLVFAFLGNFVQVGSIFSFGSVSPKFEKLNPTESFKQIFLSSRSYIELGKTFLRILIIALIVGYIIWGVREDLVRLISNPPDIVFSFTFSLILEICLKIGFVFLILGGLDFFLQRYLLRQELKMTKREIQEENKETEGNPLIKAQRRYLHSEILSNNLASAVRNADVVIANPTHISIAVKYEKSKNDAPLITAKGADLMAAHIRQIANESRIPIKHDVSLARALYELEVGDEVPEKLYDSVANILQWVYSTKESGGNTSVI